MFNATHYMCAQFMVPTVKLTATYQMNKVYNYNKEAGIYSCTHTYVCTFVCLHVCMYVCTNINWINIVI